MPYFECGDFPRAVDNLECGLYETLYVDVGGEPGSCYTPDGDKNNEIGIQSRSSRSILRDT